MDAMLAAVCGVLVAAGVVCVVAGWRTPARGRSLRSRTRGVAARAGVRRPALLAGWTLVGVASAASTGWPLLVGLVPALGVGVPVLLAKPRSRELELLQALDRWVRTLLAILPTGRSTADAIRASVRQAPDELAGPLHLLVQRLDDRWTLGQALGGFADDLDSADADAVVAALALAAERGGTGVHATLAALAESVQERLRALREVETERAKPRIVVRQVTIIMLVVLVAAFLFGGGFFAPYGSPTGQLVLAVLMAGYLGSLFALRRMAAPRRRERLLGSRP